MFEHQTLKSMDSFRKKDSIITAIGAVLILALLLFVLILVYL